MRDAKIAFIFGKFLKYIIVICMRFDKIRKAVYYKNVFFL